MVVREWKCKQGVLGVIGLVISNEVSFCADKNISELDHDDDVKINILF